MTQHRLHLRSAASLALAFLLSAVAAPAAEDFDIRPLKLDADGRFWIYGRATGDTMLPFLPYGFIPEEAAQMMKLDLRSTVAPFPEGKDAEQRPQSAAVVVKWQPPYWCGCAWIAGPEGWWAGTNKGWHYDLAKLKKKQLVFHARGATGDERIQVKVGILGDKPFGDTTALPIESRWLRLTKEWAQYKLDLTSVPESQLRRVSNGFTFVLNLDQQEGQPKETRFFLDAIYFE